MKEIQELTTRWLECLSKKDMPGILNLYRSDAALMPTLRDKIHKTPAERENYFNFFLGFPNFHGIVQDQYSRCYGDFAINTGSYKFIYTQDQKDVEILARFTFSYKKEDGRWLIVDHHSSAFPEKSLSL
ncbi:SgcJ/EcaC family oxidoreductase [Alphaproteobacteria bacterium]|nr:SgcJ/EcaC family oxidoreductase [Alphaproteobacteria bacterium]